jgi:hypothetical protein
MTSENPVAFAGGVKGTSTPKLRDMFAAPKKNARILPDAGTIDLRKPLLRRR